MPRLVALTLLCLCPLVSTGADTTFNAAAAFGARPSVMDLRLSPDGMSVAWIAPGQGQGSTVLTLNLGDKSAKPKAAITANGNPDRIRYCRWVSNERLVCTISLIRKDPLYGVEVANRVIAVNADGSSPQMLSKPTGQHQHGYVLSGDSVIDWLPDEDNAVLMSRVYVPDDHAGTRIGSTELGLGVDHLDTRTLQAHRVEAPLPNAQYYISDGRGHVRIAAVEGHDAGRNSTGTYEYLYHSTGAPAWQLLSTYHIQDHSGFVPVAVDPEKNVAYGYQQLSGRYALYSLSLDGAHDQQLVYSNSDVDVEDVMRLGRRKRVVGATYVTEYRHAVYFAPEVKALIESLRKALTQHAELEIVDASVDESRILVLSSSDTDPGVYYILDRKSHQLQTFLVVRSQLEGVELATVQPVSYAAADGTIIPGYLTLPPGKEGTKGLPAIVMPHGGPSARDEWGFDWLAQFFAARGYAVLQPNFRGSAGYGESWFRENGFRSWNVAIGDVLDGGRWLVKEGYAAPGQLAIFGWSYGGYAALQAAVVDPALFKAVVAVAPVTDLKQYKEDSRYWSSFALVSDFVGEGSHMHEGSPSEHADHIRVPVLLFHGAMDGDVSVEQSKLMERRLKSAGGKVTLVTWDDLDHALDDSAARTQLLEQSDRFLQAAFGH